MRSSEWALGSASWVPETRLPVAALAAAVLAAGALGDVRAARGQSEFGEHVVLIRQGKLPPEPILDRTIVELKRQPFELRLRTFPYDAAAREFHAVRVAAATHLGIFDAAPGADLLDSPFLGPGTGMAAGPDGYDSLFVNDLGHHYIFHDPSDAAAQRAPVVDRDADGMLELRWRIDSRWLGQGAVPIEESEIAALAVVVVSDRDLDDLIRVGEVARFVLVFRD